MSRIARFAVLVAALMSLFGVLSSAAGAVTWENGGNTSFSATAGPRSLSSTGITFACASADATGTSPSTGFNATGTGGAPWTAATGTIAFTSCVFAGSPATIDCGFTLTVPNIASSLDPVLGTVTTATGTFDVTCAWYITGTKICHEEGSTVVTYHNGVSPNRGRLNLATSNSLRVTGANCPLGQNDLVHAVPWTFLVTAGSGGTGTLGPVIVRT